MALIPCRECGRQISETAPACPGCGAVPRGVAKPAAKTSGCAWIALVLLAVPLIVFIANRADQAAAPAPKPAAVAPVTTAQDKARDDAELERCRGVLKNSQEVGLLHNMTFDDGRPKVWVGPTWYEIPIEAKTEFARTAGCFFLAGRDKRITFPIYDGTTGKQIATWRFTRLDVE